jgi:hypothetical protein
MTKTFPVATAAVSLAAGIIIGSAFHPGVASHAQADTRVFEIRTYTTPPGRLEALNSRFRDHTLKFFEKHGMTNIGYWTPADPPLAENTLIYVLAHRDREAAKKSWDAFRKDPDWVKARADSEARAGGSLTTKVESVFLTPTDYSRLK